MRPVCASQNVGGFFDFEHRVRTQAHADSQKEQLQRAGHKPVGLVPAASWLCGQVEVPAYA